MTQAGIYVYWFKNTGLDNCEQSYIGSTTNFNKRHNEHIALLRRNKHNNNKFQHAYNKYGNDNMVYERIEHVFFPDSYDMTLKREYLEGRENMFIKIKKQSVLIGRERFHNREPVLCYDRSGNFIKEYGAIKIATKELSLQQSGVIRCCTGEMKYTGQYTFKYKNQHKNGTIMS